MCDGIYTVLLIHSTLQHTLSESLRFGFCSGWPHLVLCSLVPRYESIFLHRQAHEKVLMILLRGGVK